MARDTSISICKGIAIILMVIGHAEAPRLISNFIYTFHMPLFFITAGYFFSRRNTDNPWDFCRRRFKGLYIPFLKWSLIFLILHNLWFEIGLLNEQYGNWTGGVTHPYSLKQFLTRVVYVFFSMSGYDEFITGAFWFFRGLLVSSILFLVFFMLIDKNKRLPMHSTATIICIGAVAFMAFHILSGVKISTYPNGFWRETWGIFFFGIGVIYRYYEPKIPSNGFMALLFFVGICAAAWFHCSGMNNGCKLQDLWTLPLTGCAGFLMVRYVSHLINKKEGRLRSALIFIGENTLFILIFHTISYKAVSLLKIWWYDLDPGQIGCHMVIHDYNTDFFWILYTIVGTGLPLLVVHISRKLRSRIVPALTDRVS